MGAIMDNSELKSKVLKVLKEHGQLSTYKLTGLAGSYMKAVNSILDELLKEKKHPKILLNLQKKQAVR
jgi:ribosomal protein S8